MSSDFPFSALSPTNSRYLINLTILVISGLLKRLSLDMSSSRQWCYTRLLFDLCNTLSPFHHSLLAAYSSFHLPPSLDIFMSIALLSAELTSDRWILSVCIPITSLFLSVQSEMFRTTSKPFSVATYSVPPAPSFNPCGRNCSVPPYD